MAAIATEITSTRPVEYQVMELEYYTPGTLYLIASATRVASSLRAAYENIAATAPAKPLSRVALCCHRGTLAPFSNCMVTPQYSSTASVSCFFSTYSRSVCAT